MSDRDNPEYKSSRLKRGGLAVATIWLILTPLVLLATSAAPARAVAPGTAPFRGSGLAFGVNANGEVGDGTTVDRTTPVAVKLPAGVTITAVAAGSQHTLALASTGAVFAWGANFAGQLGDATTSDSSIPTMVQLPKGTIVTAIAGGGDHSLALTSQGTVFAWGDGTATPAVVAVAPGTVVTAIAAGFSHNLALTSRGAVISWGANFSGQLGDGTNNFSSTPVTVLLPRATSVTGIAAGDNHSLALTASGGVLSWGSNQSGQLGDGTTNDNSLPVAALLPSGVVATGLSAGSEHTLALTSAGTVLAWGANLSGQLGDGTTNGSPLPVVVQLPAGSVATAVAAGLEHSLALTATRMLLAWGGPGSQQCRRACAAPLPSPQARRSPIAAAAPGAPPNPSLPSIVALPTGALAIAIAAGDQHNVMVATRLDHLVISPAASTIAIGGAQTYAAHGADVFGDDLGDVTAVTRFTVTGGSCLAATCTAGPGAHVVTGIDGAARGTATLKVVTAPPSLRTAASTSIGLPGTVFDTATLSGALQPVGTIGFQVFGPDDATCAARAVFTSTTAVAGNAAYQSAAFAPVAAGTYRFVTSYSGDVNNAPRPGLCNEANESVVVYQATPTIVTTASATVPAGGTISDSATLLGAFSPTGTVSFLAFGPDDATCARAAAFRSTRPVTITGHSASGPFARARAGTYRFTVTYSGDANNAAASSICGAPQESVVVAPAPTTTTTLAPPGNVPPVALPPMPVAPAPPPEPPPGRSVLVAVSTVGRPFGPAGSGLNVQGSNYPPSCATAYFFFDSTRIGAAPVDASGRAAAHGLSVPGFVSAGAHHVSSSCRASGHPVQETAAFAVTESSVHRSSFVTSVPEPGQISLTLKSVGLSAGIAVALLALVGFPSQVFNSTLQDNYEEVRAWFHLHRPLSEVVQDVNQRVLFPVFLAIGGVLYALLTPEFGLNLTSLALALGLAIAVAVTTFGFAVPTFAYFGLRWKDRGQILVLPGTIAIGAGFVLISRLLNLQPGYLYGLLAVFVFHHDVDKRTSGRLAAASALLVMVLAIAAWAARVPLSGATLAPGVGFWTIVLESALCGAFVIGLESTLVGLLPLRSLDGSKIKDWSRLAWFALFGLALFTLVEVLFQPGTSYVGHTSNGGKIAVVTLYLLFGVATAAFWAYFRFRPGRPTGSFEGEADLEREGDFGVR